MHRESQVGVLKQRIHELESRIAEMRQAQARTSHINSVLDAVRSVSRLILREKDRERVIQEVCDILMWSSRYQYVWMALAGPDGKLVTWAESGMEKNFETLLQQSEAGNALSCLVRSKLISCDAISFYSEVACGKCPLLPECRNGSAVILPLMYEEKNYGVFYFSFANKLPLSSQERNLMRHIAEDIGFYLYSLEMDEKRRQAEAELRRYEMILASVRDPISSVDRNYVYQTVNSVYLDMFGKSSDEILGHTIPELWGTEIFEEKVRQPLDRCFGGEEVHHQMWLNLPDGGRKFMDRAYYPVFRKDGAVTGAIMSSRDITPLKKVEGLLTRQSRELSKRVREMNCLFSISMLMEQSGISMKNLFQEVAYLLCGALRYPDITCARISLPDGMSVQTDIFRETPWRISGNIIINNNNFGVIDAFYLEEPPSLGENYFLTEEKILLYTVAERLGKVLMRKQAETALQESERRFRDLVENSSVGICIVQDHKVIYENPQQKRLSPFTRTSIFSNFRKVHPDDAENIRQLYSRLISGDVQDIETEFRFYPDREHDRNRIVWVNCRIDRICYQGKEALMVNMIDITRTREMERLLRIQDKMSSLGRVAAGIAHEIRNPLSGINIYLDTLNHISTAMEGGERIQDIVRRIQSASGKIETIIRRVMDFTRPAGPRFAAICLRKPVEDAVQLTEVTLRKKGIELRRSLSDNLPQCHADSQMIEQVLLNLVTNAADAIDDGKNPEKIIEITVSAENGWVRMSVADSGPGIPPGQSNHIFDPFYTTRRTGTGIGLSLCQRIITDHKGILDVSVSRWGGAEFVIKLPALQKVCSA